jgi:hypothetical protein
VSPTAAITADEAIAAFDGKPCPAGASGETVRCVGLPAGWFRRIGLTGSQRRSNWYDRGDFQCGDRLRLAGDAAASTGVEAEVVGSRR